MSSFQATDLLSFDKMIATKVMKFIYFVGLIGIVGFALITLFGGLTAMRSSFVMGLGTMLLAVIGAALGVLVWRVTVELWLLGFNIYDRLGEIRDNGRTHQAHNS